MKSSFLVLILAATPALAETDPPDTKPAGQAPSTMTSVLKAGAKVLQSTGPVGMLDVHLSGFHLMKENPDHQSEAHHYCRQVNEEFMQCALFDSDGDDGNLIGIEYIISERLFEGLANEEKKFWHPHNYEILSGQLVAPGIPAVAEKEMMSRKMNSYGKTWHLWDTGSFGKKGGDAVPLGEPMLMWSFNADGEADPDMIAARDKRMNLDSKEVREQRRDLASQAKPQDGVDALAARFPKRGNQPEGVRDKGK